MLRMRLWWAVAQIGVVHRSNTPGHAPGVFV